MELITAGELRKPSNKERRSELGPERWSFQDTEWRKRAF